MAALRVLIADDNAADRLILKAMLEREGHEVFAAEDGIEAVILFQKISPDIVLLDALMPNMDGKEAAVRIKALSGERLVPIIFLTSLHEADALAELIEVGGDDFLTKPYNRQLLKAKVRAFVRLKQLYQTIRHQRDEIQYHTDRLIHEQEVAKKIFDRIAHPGCLRDGNIRFNLKPKAIFNGDILLAARKPAGGLHILLGDFTGHGLPAAIGAMPLSDIFYSMTMKGYGFQEILPEINRKLVTALPVEVFCCLIAADFSPRDGLLRVWNCGMPAAFLMRAGAGLVARFESTHLPLGIQAQHQLHQSVAVVQVEARDRFLMASDGVVEACNRQGELFGESRLLALIEAERASGSVFDAVLRALAEFEVDRDALDDVSLVEVLNDFDDTALIDAPRLTVDPRPHAPDWRIDYELRSRTLAHWDPLPFLLHILMETPGLASKRGQLYTVLAELYTNALDHGVLQLSSRIKDSADGFSEYFRERERRLEMLSDGAIHFTLEQRPEPGGGRLEIRVRDSGTGFDWQKTGEAHPGEHALSGRGMALVRSICREFEVLGEGNEARAVIGWRFPDAE